MLNTIPRAKVHDPTLLAPLGRYLLAVGAAVGLLVTSARRLAFQARGSPLLGDSMQGFRVKNRVDIVSRVVGAAMVGIAALNQPALAHCQIGQVAEIPVETARNRPLARAEINGQSISVLIDTGASQSVMWRPAAARLGLHLTAGPQAVRTYGVGGESRLDATLIKELRLDKFTARDVHIPVSGDRDADFEMVLGEDFWSVTSLELDLKHHFVRMLDPKGCKFDQLAYWAKTYSMADLLAPPGGARKILVKVLLNGRTVRAQLDSGAAVSVVSKWVADQTGAPYQSASAELTGVGVKSLESWLGRFQTFSLGDETINNVQLRLAELGKNMKAQELGSRIEVAAVDVPDMLLGADFLHSHRVLIDNATRKMVFTYEGGPVFETSKPAQPSAVEPSSPAAPQAQPAAVGEPRSRNP